MKAAEASIGDLLLDDENPRLPEDLADRSQPSLLKWMADEYNTVEVARSIAQHGYFDSEPMIAIRQGKKYKIVEGNRRLTALTVLMDEGLRSSLDLEEQDEWDELAEGADIEDRFIIQVAPSREDVAPIIGYRHIAGIEPWDPWAKARFVAKQIEQRDLSFTETSRIVGERESDVRAYYRNYRVAVDAEEKLKVSAARVKKSFGFFTRAMNSVGLREHIGAPAPADVAQSKPVLSKSKKSEVRELFSWLFGTDEEPPVISESRQISDLGQVVASDEALGVLRETRNLEEALMASGGVRARLLKRIAAALGALQKAELDIALYRYDPEIQQELDACEDALRRLREK